MKLLVVIENYKPFCNIFSKLFAEDSFKKIRKKIALCYSLTKSVGNNCKQESLHKCYQLFWSVGANTFEGRNGLTTLHCGLQ